MAETQRAWLKIRCGGGEALLVVLLRFVRGVTDPVKVASFAAEISWARRQTTEYETGTVSRTTRRWVINACPRSGNAAVHELSTYLCAY